MPEELAATIVENVENNYIIAKKEKDDDQKSLLTLSNKLI